MPVPTLSTAQADPTPVAVSGTPFVSSRYGYGLTIPDGWTLTEVPGTGGLHPDEPGVDTYQGTNGRILSVVGETLAPGGNLGSWSCAIGQHLTRDHQTPVESTELLMVAGKTARLTRYHLHIDPYVIHYLNVEIVDGGEGLTLSMESTAHDDAADEVVIRSILDGLTLS